MEVKKSSAGVVMLVLNFVLLSSFLVAWIVFSDKVWLTTLAGLLFLGSCGFTVFQQRKNLRGRSIAYGANSFITIFLVFCIVSVLNFISYRNNVRFDWTATGQNTLSEQTVQLLEKLQEPVRATLFVKTDEKEAFKTLLDRYASKTKLFEVSYSDPDRDVLKAKALRITRYGTLHLALGSKELQLDEVTEEKLTNAIIKLLKSKAPEICALTGHGENSFKTEDKEGASFLKNHVEAQSYTVKELNLLKEPEALKQCDVLSILGPNRAFFEHEIKLIHEYVEAGGRLLVALDLNLGGVAEYAPQLNKFLEQWHVKFEPELIVDPTSAMVGLDPSQIILGSYDPYHPIAKDFRLTVLMPMSRPLTVVPGAPSDLTISKLAFTTDKAFSIKDLKSLQKEGGISVDPDKGTKGPFTAVVALEKIWPSAAASKEVKDVPDASQKDSNTTGSKGPKDKKTRMVVFGSSVWMGNNYVRFTGNLDLFTNTLAWLVEDDSFITIRTKESPSGRLTLSAQMSNMIKLLSVVLLPSIVAFAGLVVWMRRRQL